MRHVVPAVLLWIQVWGTGRPVHSINVFVMQELLTHFSHRGRALSWIRKNPGSTAPAYGLSGSEELVRVPLAVRPSIEMPPHTSHAGGCCTQHSVFREWARYTNLQSGSTHPVLPRTKEQILVLLMGWGPPTANILAAAWIVFSSGWTACKNLYKLQASLSATKRDIVKSKTTGKKFLWPPAAKPFLFLGSSHCCLFGAPVVNFVNSWHWLTTLSASYLTSSIPQRFTWFDIILWFKSVPLIFIWAVYFLYWLQYAG